MKIRQGIVEVFTGYYFVTICTQNRKELFGEIIDGRMIANAAGKMVEETWDELSRFYEGIRTDQFQIMPNHVHGIIAIVHVGTVPVRIIIPSTASRGGG